jgi:hypothetical protein
MNSYSLATIGRHLISCEKRREQLSKGKTHKTFILSIKGIGVTGYTYWMFLEVNPRLKLQDLDAFLRKRWVECCSHLSQFLINGQYYISDGAKEPGEKSMNYKLKDLLKEGAEFLYEYDFGTTTILKLKVIKVDEGMEDSIGILAINEAPKIPCAICGKEDATQICTECLYEGEETAFFCDKCAEKHEHDDMLLPLVNSPRTGMCGYTG